MGTGHTYTHIKATLCIHLLTTMWGQMEMGGKKRGEEE